MTKDDQFMEISPREILTYIFTLLEPKYLAKCRQVCSRWKLIIDSLLTNENLWRKHCIRDFGDIYEYAQQRCISGLSWSNLYKSLFLWSKLGEAVEDSDEVAVASSSSEEIRNFQILRGIIGVHARESIKYYDINSLKETKRNPISGNYIRYAENDDAIVILGYNLSLFIVRKVVKDIKSETNQTFDNVKTFLLVDDIVFYVTLNDGIYSCSLDVLDLRCEFLRQIKDVVSLGYSDGKLNILTTQLDVYSVAGKELTLKKSIVHARNLLNELKKFNFIENLDWTAYYQWIFSLKHPFPDGPLRHISVIRTYGKTIFVGTHWGVLRIYYEPYINGEFDIFNSEPVKQFNFMQRPDLPVLTMNPISQIDIIEGVNNHIVLVAMPKKIVTLTFSHNLKKVPMPLLPYKEIQSIKILDVSD